MLSPILCNIYLNELDHYIHNEIINRLQNKIIDSQDLLYNSIFRKKKFKYKKEFIDIKYIRYADLFLIGVRGSYNFTVTIKTKICNFLRNNLQFNIYFDTTRVINTYNIPVKFLGMLLINKHTKVVLNTNSKILRNIKNVVHKFNVIRYILLILQLKILYLLKNIKLQQNILRKIKKKLLLRHQLNILINSYVGCFNLKKKNSFCCFGLIKPFDLKRVIYPVLIKYYSFFLKGLNFNIFWLGSIKQ